MRDYFEIANEYTMRPSPMSAPSTQMHRSGYQNNEEMHRIAREEARRIQEEERRREREQKRRAEQMNRSNEYNKFAAKEAVKRQMESEERIRNAAPEDRARIKREERRKKFKYAVRDFFSAPTIS